MEADFINKAVKESYSFLLSTPTKKQWEIIGVKRRSGVATPLFSLYSKDSLGIGEILDLKLLIDWCKKTGLGIIQLLPMNDVAYSFSPYESLSSFALDPMYVSIKELIGVNLEPFKEELDSIKIKFVNDSLRVNYEIKRVKLDLLWKIFQSISLKSEKRFIEYKEENFFWLRDYSLFKVIKENCSYKPWFDWDTKLKEREANALSAVEEEYKGSIEFHMWVQWQLYEQFKSVKQYANKNDVLLMGDLPILVSMDSADVWAYRSYFKLDLSIGAPPDLFFSKGQRWGMPAYNWSEIQKNNYDYVINKLKYAERLYDLFRIDHAVGLFRIWTIKINEPEENYGFVGVFDPADESLWEEHGSKILSVIVQNTTMLPCAEDLGTVPKCSYKVLKEFGIPGTDIQRWVNGSYRLNSVSAISTHDTTSLCNWWENEIKTPEERMQFWKYFDMSGEVDEKVSYNLIKRVLEKASSSESIFSIQLLQDWLSLTDLSIFKSNNFRINVPGTISDLNWSIKMPLSLEEMNGLEINKVIREINVSSSRV